MDMLCQKTEQFASAVDYQVAQGCCGITNCSTDYGFLSKVPVLELDSRTWFKNCYTPEAMSNDCDLQGKKRVTLSLAKGIYCNVLNLTRGPQASSLEF